MKKTFIVPLLILCLFIVFTGCSKTEKHAEKEEAKVKEGVDKL